MSEKTVLITGCSSGIGRASALAFREAEWRVYATARDEGDLADLDDAGCETAALDVTDDGQVRSIVERVADQSGRIDCLVNNAGYAQLGPVEEVPTERVRAQFDVNVYGPHRLLRAVLPHMRDRGAGRIINVSSAGGQIAGPGTGVYSASKFALEGLSDALRTEIEEYGIDVCVIEPGPVATGFGTRATDSIEGTERTGAYETFYDLYEDSVTIGSDGPLAVRPERVAEAIVDAAVSPEPPTRYPVGPIARVASYARFLPDRLRDTVFGLFRRFA